MTRHSADTRLTWIGEILAAMLEGWQRAWERPRGVTQAEDDPGGYMDALTQSEPPHEEQL